MHCCSNVSDRALGISVRVAAIIRYSISRLCDWLSKLTYPGYNIRCKRSGQHTYRPGCNNHPTMHLMACADQSKAQAGSVCSFCCQNIVRSSNISVGCYRALTLSKGYVLRLLYSSRLPEPTFVQPTEPVRK